MVIPYSDYDSIYWGLDPDLKRTSGYSEPPKRWFRTRDIMHSVTNQKLFTSTGEFWKDITNRFVNLQNILAGKKVLELGAGFAFIAEDARALGVDWNCVDVSQAAKDNSPASVQPFYTVANALTHLTTLANNSFDFIVSFRFIECIEPLVDLPALIALMNLKGKKQIHVIDETPNPAYYNAITLEDYKANYSWKNGTILIKNENLMSENPKIVIK